MYCSNCGKEQPASANFCSGCGSSTTVTPAITSQAPPSRPVQVTPPATVAAQALISKKQLGTKWFTFWTYINLPIMGGLGVLVAIALATKIFWLGAALFVICVPYLAAAYGLHKRKVWGWRLNWLTIAINCVNGLVPNSLETFGDPITSRVLAEVAVRAVFVSIVWVLPNIIYWRKRRFMFT